MAVSRRLRFEILRRDGHTCRYCGAKAPDVALTVDHVVPVTLGGSDDPSNLVTACDPCNSGKTSVPPGAELVAQVADDAIRWRRAIEQARMEYEAERQVVDELLEEFRVVWTNWTYPVEVEIPAEPLDTGNPLMDRWFNIMGWSSNRHGEPVSAVDGVLTIKAEKGYVREVRSDATTSLGQWSEALGQPLHTVVIEPVRSVTVPPLPPRPTKVVERRRHPLDNNWRESVSRFLSHGLTIDDLERLVEIGMRKDSLAKSETFRYFCGCAWREITDLQESARRILESESIADDPGDV